MSRHRPPTPPPGALAPQAPPERLSALLREHARLRAAVAKKWDERARAARRAEELARAVASQVHPIVEEIFRLDAAIHTVFQELLRPRRLSTRARASVRRIYRELQEGGTLTPREELDADLPPGPPGATDDEPSPYDPDWRETPSAPRPQGPASSALRELFRRLASALHPDKVQAADQKEIRTEAMKEVTRAYQEGDLARLLELEQRHARGEALSAEEEDATMGKCRSLERLNEALAAQLDDLRRELREVRGGPVGELLRELQRSRVSPEEAVADLAAEAEAGVARFRRLLEFVADFRDGKLSLDEFLAGPGGPPGEDEEAFEDALFEALSAMAESVETQAPRSKGKKPRKGKRR